MTRARRVQLAVPAYFHPATAPSAWDRLVELAARLRFVVLNVESGPGSSPDVTYQEVARRLRVAGGKVVGYVDSGYGRRPTPTLLAEIDAYRRWYQVDGIFLDQVDGRREALPSCAAVADAARARGLTDVVLNPGSPPNSGFHDLADVVVTFEGPWSDYAASHRAWSARGVQCHLVYDVPEAEYGAVAALALRRHAEIVYATKAAGANPWAELSDFVAQVG